MACRKFSSISRVTFSVQCSTPRQEINGKNALPVPEGIQTIVTHRPHYQSANFYDTGLLKCIQQYEKCYNSAGSYAENYLKYCFILCNEPFEVIRFCLCLCVMENLLSDIFLDIVFQSEYYYN